MIEEVVKEKVFERLILKYGDELLEKIGDNFVYVNGILVDAVDFTLEEMAKKVFDKKAEAVDKRIKEMVENGEESQIGIVKV